MLIHFFDACLFCNVMLQVATECTYLLVLIFLVLLIKYCLLVSNLFCNENFLCCNKKKRFKTKRKIDIIMRS